MKRMTLSELLNSIETGDQKQDNAQSNWENPSETPKKNGTKKNKQKKNIIKKDEIPFVPSSDIDSDIDIDTFPLESGIAEPQYEAIPTDPPPVFLPPTQQNQQDTESDSADPGIAEPPAPASPQEPVPPPQKEKKPHSKVWIVLIIVMLILAGLYYIGIRAKSPSGKPPAESPVITARPYVVTDTLQNNLLHASPTPTNTPTQTSTPIITATPAAGGIAVLDNASPSPSPLLSPAPTYTPLPTYTPQPEATPHSVFIDWVASQTDTSPYFTEYFFPEPRLMSGIYSKLGMYVSLPEYIHVNTATLQVSYTCSDLILASVSSLTFYVNSLPIYSCSVEYMPSGPTLLSIEVPVDLLSEAYNLIEIRGYSRLVDDESCMDEYAEANWIQFGEQTCLRIGYNLVDNPDVLSCFPYPFISIQDPTGQHLSVAIPDSINESELEAALLIMAELGGAVSAENEIELTAWSNVSDPRVIFVGLEDHLPQEIEQLTGGIDVPGDSALIYSVTNGGRKYLLLIGATPEALTEAAQLMSDSSRVKQLIGTTHTVASGASAVILEQAALSDTVVQNTYTLKDIVGKGLDFVGPFHQEVTIELPISSDYTLSGQSKFTFNIRYSDNLDFNRSLMTVYIDDIPIFSKKLTMEGAEGDIVTFLPSADMEGQPISYMRITFDLEIEDLECTPRQLDTPWAHITEDSTFYLPPGECAALNLSNLPSPFQRNGIFNNVMAVIPDQPSASEILLLGRTVAMLGSGSRPYGTLAVRRAKDFDETDIDHNLLIIGGAKNSLIKALNEKLFIAYNESYTGFASNEKLILDDMYAQRLGAIELLTSPYNSQYAALVLTAPAESGTNLLIQLISHEVMRWNLADDAVVINPKNEINSYQFQSQETPTEQKPNLMASVSQNASSIIFAMIGIAVMIILLLAVVMVLIRIRMRSK